VVVVVTAGVGVVVVAAKVALGPVVEDTGAFGDVVDDTAGGVVLVGDGDAVDDVKFGAGAVVVVVVALFPLRSLGSDDEGPRFGGAVGVVAGGCDDGEGTEETVGNGAVVGTGIVDI
jgi:hypothetical protein